MQTENISKPWYKQFWPWMIIGLPTSVVVASVVTYIIALNGIDSVITKDYYKEGLAINTDLSRDKQATALGLSANVSLDGQTVTIKLAARDAQTITALGNQPLKFELENLSFQANNLEAVLMPAESGVWRGQMTGKTSQATWQARLTSGDWRISQRLENLTPTQFELKP